jgi:hypothetical protein
MNEEIKEELEKVNAECDDFVIRTGHIDRVHAEVYWLKIQLAKMRVDAKKGIYKNHDKNK